MPNPCFSRPPRLLVPVLLLLSLRLTICPPTRALAESPVSALHTANDPNELAAVILTEVRRQPLPRRWTFTLIHCDKTSGIERHGVADYVEFHLWDWRMSICPEHPSQDSRRRTPTGGPYRVEAFTSFLRQEHGGIYHLVDDESHHAFEFNTWPDVMSILPPVAPLEWVNRRWPFYRTRGDWRSSCRFATAINWDARLLHGVLAEPVETDERISRMRLGWKSYRRSNGILFLSRTEYYGTPDGGISPCEMTMAVKNDGRSLLGLQFETETTTLIYLVQNGPERLPRDEFRRLDTAFRDRKSHHVTAWKEGTIPPETVSLWWVPKRSLAMSPK